MKKETLTLSLFLFINVLQAQNPLVKQWDNRFGGDTAEWLTSLHQTIDGGYILGGYSESGISGDKTQANRDTVCFNGCTNDYWIVKTDSLGNKEWDKRFGGNYEDELYSIQQTVDGGYILGGWSNSDSSGDKTQPSWGAFGSMDYWIVKIDSLGNKLWDKRFGGTGYEEFRLLQQTTDGGYILGGFSNSGIGGDKTQPNWDTTLNSTFDYWIVKIDSLGNKKWDKRFGGTSDDLFSSLEQTTDKGYILGGWSTSGINGDKTQPNWDTSMIFPTYDYWIVKTDSLGNKEWDKRFGGTDADWLKSLQQTADGGYILGGWSYSGLNGDKTHVNWGGNSDIDFWIIKTDSAGNKQWDKNFGGTNVEFEFGNIIQTPDSGYLFSGQSSSPISGDKTENNLGSLADTWVVKINSAGNKIWDKTVFTTDGDQYGFAIPVYKGCYAIANYTNSGIGGYKTQPNWDSTHITNDYWIVKFCDTTLTGINHNLNLNSDISIFPNPFNTEISITFQKQNLKQATFTIKNILGQILFFKSENNLNSSYTKALGLSFLAKGIYLLEVNIHGERTVKKIVRD